MNLVIKESVEALVLFKILLKSNLASNKSLRLSFNPLISRDLILEIFLYSSTSYIKAYFLARPGIAPIAAPLIALKPISFTSIVFLE